MLAKATAKSMGMWVRAAFTLLMILSVSTVGERASARALDPLSSKEVEMREAQLNYTSWNGQAVESDVNEGSVCGTSKLQLPVIDPVTGLGWPILVEVYKPTGKSKAPVVIVVPTMDGVTVVEPKIATQLCEAGIGAVIADVVDTSLPKVMPAWGLEDIHARRAILALRTLIDVVQALPAFDRDRVGVIGNSLGAIMTSMFAALEPQRLKAVVLSVAGGNLPYIMSVSDNEKVSELREERMAATGLASETDYENALRSSILYDPEYFATPAIKNHLMMITADSDTKVPSAMQKELYSAFGEPTLSEYSGGHVETILKMAYIYFGDVLTFFKGHFGMASQSKKLAPVTFRD